MMQGARLEVLVATRNPGKIAEIRSGLRGLPLSLRYLEEFADVAPVEEVGSTYEENASLKAMNYSKQSGLTSLADDSGLEVSALGGMPGVFSARYGGARASDQERIGKLLLALSQHPTDKRAAHFVCCLALSNWQGEEQPDGPAASVLNVTRGECQGLIAEQPRGQNGFGYDPVFVPNGYRATFAELPAEVKSRISHRAKAVAKMREFLASQLSGGLI